MAEKNKDQNKWRGTSFPWTRLIKMLILPKLIYRCNKLPIKIPAETGRLI